MLSLLADVLQIQGISMAGETFVLEDWVDLLAEIDVSGLGGICEANGQACEAECEC